MEKNDYTKVLFCPDYCLAPLCISRRFMRWAHLEAKNPSDIKCKLWYMKYGEIIKWCWRYWSLTVFCIYKICKTEFTFVQISTLFELSICHLVVDSNGKNRSKSMRFHCWHVGSCSALILKLRYNNKFFDFKISIDDTDGCILLQEVSVCRIISSTITRIWKWNPMTHEIQHIVNISSANIHTSRTPLAYKLLICKKCRSQWKSKINPLSLTKMMVDEASVCAFANYGFAHQPHDIM